jgi:hypothetical protein
MHALIRRQAEFAEADRSYHEDLKRLECMLLSREVAELLEKEGMI